MPPIGVALQHFWSAYAEVPKNNKRTISHANGVLPFPLRPPLRFLHPVREANPTRLERVKAVLGYKYDPKCNIEAVREQKTAAIVQYLQAKSVAEKADAALALFSADESMKNQAEAFRTALQRARSDAEKETVVRQHLRWEEATEAAEELTQRHPEFTELKEVVSQFPPIVHFIGEPSTAHYKLKVPLLPLLFYQHTTLNLDLLCRTRPLAHHRPGLQEVAEKQVPLFSFGCH